MNLVSEDINQYCEAHSSVPSEHCAAIAAHTRANVPYPQMLTGPLEASFLGFLIHAIGARRILEFGTYTGYSALAMAERLPDDGEVVTLDINPETVALAKSFWEKSPHGRKVRSVLGPALQSVDSLQGDFDLVFIDAEKTEYLEYLKKVLPKLSARGVIAVDNVLWSGRVLEKSPTSAETRAIQQFNEFVRKRQDLEVALLPVRDGIYLIRKR